MVSLCKKNFRALASAIPEIWIGHPKFKTTARRPPGPATRPGAGDKWRGADGRTDGRTRSITELTICTRTLRRDRPGRVDDSMMNDRRPRQPTAGARSAIYCPRIEAPVFLSLTRGYFDYRIRFTVKPVSVSLGKSNGLSAVNNV